MYYYQPMHNAFLGWGIIGMLFWLIVMVIIVIIISRVFRHTPDTTNHNTPLEIAKTRYAKGEISKEEFEQLRKDLK